MEKLENTQKNTMLGSKVKKRQEVSRMDTQNQSSLG